MEPPVFCPSQPQESAERPSEGYNHAVLKKRGCGVWSAVLQSQLFPLAANRREAGTCPLSPKWKSRPWGQAADTVLSH